MEKFFSDNNVIALFEIESIKDIYTVKELGGNLFITNQYGDGFEYFELDENDVETEPTEDQVLEREIEAFHNGETLYACHYIGANTVVPEKYTIMTTDINVGQKVFYMGNNKITTGVVSKIQMCTVGETITAQFEVIRKGVGSSIFRRTEIFTTQQEAIEYLSNHVED